MSASDTQRPSVFQSLFDTALEEFEKQTGTSLAGHPLAIKLDSCGSVESITAALQEQAQAFRNFRGDGGKVIKCLKGVVRVLNLLSTTGVFDTISSLFPPAKAIFTGMGILLSAIKDVSASYDALCDLLQSVESFVERLKIYVNIPLKEPMSEMIVKILVELLSTFALATKEIKQGRCLKFGKKLLRESDVEAVLQRLDKLTREEGHMAVAQTLEVVYGLLQNMSVVMEDSRASRDNIQEALMMVHQLASEIKESRRREMRNWLSPPDPWKNYNIARETLHEGTTKWFTNGYTFAEWKSSSSLLWIHGKPGSGKSVLSSAIIQDIEEMKELGSASLAFFFFDFRDEEKQTRRSLILSLLIQLCDQSDACYDILFDFYSNHQHGSRHSSDGELTECLKEMLKFQGRDPIYIIIDALDECPHSSGIPSPRENVLKLIGELVDLHCPSLHICVLSRPEPDIENILSHFARHSVSLHLEDGQRQDIIDYIHHVVNSNPDMGRWRPQDKKLVIDTLSKRADGMFRWVFCQLEFLRQCLPQRVRRALDELPETLDETYERTLQRIGKAKWEYAHRLFQCVAVASRPLRVEELAEFLLFDFDAGSIPDFDPGWRPENPGDAVLSICSSLLAIVNVNGSRIIQFSHYSVKEYLTSERISKAGDAVSRYHVLMEPAHTVVAQACLAVLLNLSPNSNTSTIKSIPLVYYAARHWVDHALFENVSRNIQDGTKRLFDPNQPYFVVWVWISATTPGFLLQTALESVSRLTQTPSDSDICCDFRDMKMYTVTEHPLDTTSWLRLAERAYSNARVKEKWTPVHWENHDGYLGDVSDDENSWDTDDRTSLAWALNNEYLEFVWVLLKYGSNWMVRDRHKRTPLHWASEKGLLEVCRVLLDRGADGNDRDTYNETPLHRALEYGHLEVAQLLLRHGADVNSRYALGETPLHQASGNGRLAAAQLLLVHGADVNSRDSLNGTPLHRASENGCLEVVQLLLSRSADANSKNGLNLTPLHRASEKGHLEVAQRLLVHGADVNSRDNLKVTPLHRASENGCLEVVQLLLSHGADVNSKDGLNLTPLHRALEKGRLEIAQRLLVHGADVNSRDSLKVTPLHRASENGCLEVVQLLLSHGADVNSRNSLNETPLHRALENGCLEVVQLILSHGADVNSKYGLNLTPLHRASELGHLEDVQRLLVHDADVNSRNSLNETPLHRASENGCLEVVQLLLSHGADVDSKDDLNLTPLHRALEEGRLEVAQRLLVHRANVNSRNRQNETPLHRASKNGCLEVVQLLLSHGADVNSKDSRNMTPLHRTSEKGRLEVAQRLLVHGADVNSRNRQDETPLHLASANGCLDVAQLLLLHDADANTRNKFNSTPLDRASMYGHLEVAQLLRSHGADVDSPNS